jgi:hypothetical protein
MVVGEILPPFYLFIMEALEQSYNMAMEKPLQILEIFNEFFGEDRVDMQGFPTLAEVRTTLPSDASVASIKLFISNKIGQRDGFILVHFPHVRITNEYNRSTDIKHLYAKVIIDVEGRIQGRFLLNRSEYTVLHFTNGYMHSHISQIPTHNFEDFQIPCTGSGPINNTICSLAADFDADLWRLFCLELDRYTQVESIAGTPYHRFEHLVEGGYARARRVYNEIVLQNPLRYSNRGSQNVFDTIFRPSNLADFTKYVIDSNILKFNYQNKAYHLAMKPEKFYILISNLFIKWYNKKFKRNEFTFTQQQLISNNILTMCKYSNEKLLKEGNGSSDYQTYIGAKICTFKGETVRLVISDARTETDPHHLLIMNKGVADYVYTKIFNVINFRYGNDKRERDSSGEEVLFL